MSNALETQGVQIKRGDGATPTEAFTLISEIVSFQGPGGTANVIDVTSLDSTAKEKRMGLRDEGQFTFELNYIPSDTQQQGLLSDRAARTLRNFEIIWTDFSGGTPSKSEFSAFVLGFSVQGGVDDKVGASVTLEISGAVTNTAGSV